MTHPNEVHQSWHEKEAIFWELQNRHGVPGFHGDRHSWDLFETDFDKAVKHRTKRNYAIYVRAYDFGKYPAIYEEMESVGARVISLQEADDLVAAGKTIPGVPGASLDHMKTKQSPWWKFWNN